MGSAAQFNNPNGGQLDLKGNIYVADTGNHRIRKITPEGLAITVAGTGIPGYLDGLAREAMFNQPIGVCVDSDGAIYVADTGNNRIRKITSDGNVSTIAGSGLAGHKDGSGTSAWFNFPNDLAVDSAGILYVSEFNNHSIRKINRNGGVSTWIGNGTEGYSDGIGQSAKLNRPGGIFLDEGRNLYIAEWGGQRIRKANKDGMVNTIAGTGVAGYLDGNANTAKFYNPDGIAVDAIGYVYVADNGNHAIRRISPTGWVETVAGSGTAGYMEGDGAKAQFANPSGIGLDFYGSLYVSDFWNHRLRKIEITRPASIGRQPQSQIACTGSNVLLSVTVVGTPPLTYQWQKDGFNLPGLHTNTLQLTKIRPKDAGDYQVIVSNFLGMAISQKAQIAVTGMVYFITNEVWVKTLAGNDNPGYANGTGSQAQFTNPDGGYTDSMGNIYVADVRNHCIRKVNADGIVIKLAGTGSPGFLDGPVDQAMFSFPLGICTDDKGNIYVADTGNNRIRKITADGHVSTVAGNGQAGYHDGAGSDAQFNFPNDIAIDKEGSLFVCELNNHTIRKISSNGIVITWVGNGFSGYVNGPRLNARLNQPSGICLDKEGNLFIAERAGHRIRKVTLLENVTSFAGTGKAGYLDGNAGFAQFRYPSGLFVDLQGYVYIADSGNHVIRRISPNNWVETVAGAGVAGFADGEGSEALFASPSGIGLDGKGNLYVTDYLNFRIRTITTARPLEIYEHTQNQIAAAGANVNLSISAWGTPPLFYQWLKDGKIIECATNSSLILTNTHQAQSGSYSVIISNRTESIQSPVILLETRPWLKVIQTESEVALEYHLSQRGGEAAIYQAESLEGLLSSYALLTTLDPQVAEGRVLLTHWQSQAKKFYFLIEGSLLNPNPQRLVWIAPGVFMMGSPSTDKDRESDESPQTQVAITQGFWISKYEVTQKEFQTVMGNNPSYFTGDLNLPVEQVSWFDATNYCDKLTAQERSAGRIPAGYAYRLPTEAEWECACRAGTTTRFSYGDDLNYASLGIFAWFDDNSNGVSHPVGQKQPNPWRLYDMYGNVFEWCMDWYGVYPGGYLTNPTGPNGGQYRVVRGGGWNLFGWFCRSACRDGYSPIGTYNRIGFRPVLAPIH